LPGGARTIVALACIVFLSTACTIVLSLFPAEDDAHPAFTLFKVVIMYACAADRRRCNLSLKPPLAATRYRFSMKAIGRSFSV
jgi:hypothetical protein